jgi:hypothetical protein
VLGCNNAALLVMEAVYVRSLPPAPSIITIIDLERVILIAEGSPHRMMTIAPASASERNQNVRNQQAPIDLPKRAS